MKKSVFTLTSFAAATGMLLAACGGAAPTPQVVEKIVTSAPQVVTQVVKEVQTQVVKEVQTQVVTKTEVKDLTNRIPVRWYIGLGTGSQKDQITVQKEWVDKFNKAQDKYFLTAEIVDNSVAAQNLKAIIASGNSPDIIGPVGKSGRAAFKGGLLDIDPLVKKNNVDLSKIDKSLLEFVKDDNTLVGLPYALFPAATFFNKDAFDEAKMPYPPQKYGDKYKFPDGTEKEWNLDTMFEVAAKLTVDKNGKDATQPGFDPKNIVQWGLDTQWANGRSEWSFCGAGTPMSADGKTAKIPEAWADCIQKVYDAMWKTHSWPNAAARGSELLTKPNAFASGNVAMTNVPSWYMCCLGGGNLKRWGVGISPSNKGKITNKIDGDTFSIMKGSKNPDAAFAVMQEMMKSKELETLYNGLPSGDAERKAYFASKEKQYNLKPGDVNWQVFIDGIPYANNPHHETWIPNFLKSEARMVELQTLLQSKAGLDVKAEIAKLEADLNKLWAETNYQ